MKIKITPSMIGFLVGAIYGLLSIAPYMGMVAGYVEPPIWVFVLSFPAYIGLFLNRFLYTTPLADYSGLGTPMRFFGELFFDALLFITAFILPMIIGGLAGMGCVRIFKKVKNAD